MAAVLRPLVFATLLGGMVGCTTLPNVVVKDPLADDRTRYLAGNGVRVVKPEHAKQFDDPAWPSPIQVVAPRRDTGSGRLKRIGGDQEIYIFRASGRSQRIERLYVENARLNECRAALDGIGLAHREHKPAFIKVGEGGGNLIRCGSIIIESDTLSLEFRHPFINTYQPVDLADLSHDSHRPETGYQSDTLDSQVEDQRRYPIIIRYLED